MADRTNDDNDFNRRDFLKGATTAALTAGLVSPTTAKALVVPPGNSLPKLQPPPDINARRGTEKFWRKVRDAFVLDKDYIHMNTGTTGSQPRFSLNNLLTYNVYKSTDPRDWEQNLNADYPHLFPLGEAFFGPQAIVARQEWVARVYGADLDEIVLSYNTTDACNLIFAGTPWQPGDRIITTSFEHPALAGPIAWARDYRGVEVVVIDIPSTFSSDITVEEVVSWFQTELEKPIGLNNRQYVAFSEIFYKNGVRMPVEAICQAASELGAYTIVDTAHGWGMLPIDCHAYGADFIAGAGHKWLCGGPGTGILYVRTKLNQSNLLEPPPFALGNFFLYGNLFQEPSGFFESRDWAPNIFMQFRGEINKPALYAMTDSLAFFEQIGIDAIYDRGVDLGNYLKDLIENQWPNALWVQKNPDPAFATALTSFNPFEGKDDNDRFDTIKKAINDIVAALAQETPKIYIRSVTWRDSVDDLTDNRIGFRISTHAVYNNYDEIDYVFARLVDLIDEIGKKYGLQELGELF